MPGLTADMVRGPLNADYDDIVYLSQGIAEMLTDASQAIMLSEKDTQLSFDLSGRQGLADTGMLQQSGVWSNLPAEEGYIAPLEGKTSGSLVIDGMMAGTDLLIEPINATVSDGRVINISGGEEALVLEKILSEAD
jgi:aminopeptidase